jgi:predicted phosphodiesterase
MQRLLCCVIFLILSVASLAKQHEHADYLDAVNHSNTIVQIDNNITLLVSTNLLQKSGDELTVTWHGVPNPSKDDWVGAFSPGNVHTIPIRWKMAETSKDYLTTGSGSFKFNLVNQRADYAFAFMRNKKDKPVALAVSSLIHFKQGAAEPTGEHLSLTHVAGEMRVVWTSSAVTAPAVRWGKARSNFTGKATAKSTTYTRDHMCGGRAKTDGWRDPGWLQTAVMTGLAAGEKYYYTVGDAATNTWGTEHVFYTPHPPATNTHIVVWGDMGGAPRDGSLEVDEHKGATKVTKQISNEVALGNVDLALHIGDISYARGYSHIWDEYMHDVINVTSRVAYMMAIGNHEMDYPGSGSYFKGTDSGGECGVVYDTRFPMVRSNVKFPDRLWYSFEIGYAHYIVIDTEHDFRVGSAQHAFIVKDLESVNRTRTPWIIVAGHRPQYCASSGGQSVERLMRKSFEDLWHQHKVDLCLWGHHHSYQRTKKVFHEKVNAQGTVHIVVGTGGVGLSKNCMKTPPAYYEVVDCGHFGYGRIRVSKQELAWEFVGIAGHVRDHVTLTK